MASCYSTEGVMNQSPCSDICKDFPNCEQKLWYPKGFPKNAGECLRTVSIIK